MTSTVRPYVDIRMGAPVGYVCKRCGGPSPVGVGYAAPGAAAAAASEGLTRCQCGYSVRADAECGSPAMTWASEQRARRQWERATMDRLRVVQESVRYLCGGESAAIFIRSCLPEQQRLSPEGMWLTRERLEDARAYVDALLAATDTGEESGSVRP